LRYSPIDVDDVVVVDVMDVVGVVDVMDVLFFLSYCHRFTWRKARFLHISCKVTLIAKYWQNA
jgi:hypothetical protein